MADTNKNQQEDSQTQSLITAFVKAGEAIEATHAASDKAVVDFIVNASKQMATGGPPLTDMALEYGGKAVDLGKEVLSAAGNSVKEIGGNWADSLTKNNAIARSIRDDDTKQPTEEEIASAVEDAKRFSLEAQAAEGTIGNVSRDAFHLTTTMPICTANAVLRCSCGLAFGPLKVLPYNRTQIGTPPNPVATIFDCIPNEVNIPQFILCFNILNPAVAAATAIATAAKGGVFTLAPAPCFGTMAPTPWIPTTKNTCGKTPLLTQSSSSVCWGLGSINILHCGQGIMPGLLNRFRVPGDVLATVKGYIESLVNLAGGLQGMASVASKITGPVSKAFQLSKLQKASQGLQMFSQSSKVGSALEWGQMGLNTLLGGISIGEGNYGDAASTFTDVLITAITKKKAQGAPPRQPSTAQTRATQQLADAREAQKTARGNLNSAKTEQGKAASKLAEAESAQKQADNNFLNAQNTQNQASQNLTQAQSQQTKAGKNLEEATGKQSTAEEQLRSAKQQQKEADKTLKETQETQQKANQKFQDATEARDRVYNDPNSTALQRADADLAVADAKMNKGLADADVAGAQQAKAKADNQVRSANQKMDQADANVETAKAQKKAADDKVTEAQQKFDDANNDLVNKLNAKDEADAMVRMRQTDKAIADAGVHDAQTRLTYETQKTLDAGEALNQANLEQLASEESNPVLKAGLEVIKQPALKVEGETIDEFAPHVKPKDILDKYL